VKPTDGKPAEPQVEYEPSKKRWRLLRHRRRDDRPTWQCRTGAGGADANPGRGTDDL